MRKYQRRAVALMRQHYQSNDPMHWCHLAIVMGVERKMTKRERRIFIRRSTKMFREFGLEARKMLETFTEVMSGALASVVALVDVFRQKPELRGLNLKPGPLVIDEAMGLPADFKLPGIADRWPTMVIPSNPIIGIAGVDDEE